ncbi:MAG: hypothetical protein NC314_00595 [Roseburia sp.]|nr:hypothetical protein [Ruminococcus sp.]MCM1154185.1 hypothetical protein [Roseburia sp.]MCM1241311.1 hypothetical protein [Roseburia sp.]
MGVGMGLKVSISNSKAKTTSIELRNRDGSKAGTLTISKPTNRYAKKKKLSYNFKRISTKIMSTKSSGVAGRVVREARSELVNLLLKEKSAQYDSQEVKSAIKHARAMERIAKKKKKHMEEEERAKQTGSTMIEDELETTREQETEEEQEQEEVEMSSQQLEQLARELEQLMKESEQEMEELAEELVSASWEHMDEKDVENLKKKHRADELREIMEADMKYLKALFDRLAKEQQANANGSSSLAAAFDSADPAGGVSLEIAGVEMPVEVADVPVTVEGASVDVSL